MFNGKTVDILLLAGLVMASLFCIAKVQDKLPGGMRKMAMTVAPVPTGVTSPSLTTFLMIAVILILADGMHGKYFNAWGGGSRKGQCGSMKGHCGGTRKGVHHPSRKLKHGSRKGRLALQSGGVYGEGVGDIVPTPGGATKGEFINIGGDSCNMRTRGVPAPLVSVEGTSTDIGPMFRQEIDQDGAAAIASEGGSVLDQI